MKHNCVLCSVNIDKVNLLEALEELYRQTYGLTDKFHPNSLLGEALTKAKQAIAKTMGEGEGE